MLRKAAACAALCYISTWEAFFGWNMGVLMHPAMDFGKFPNPQKTCKLVNVSKCYAFPIEANKEKYLYLHSFFFHTCCIPQYTQKEENTSPDLFLSGRCPFLCKNNPASAQAPLPHGVMVHAWALGVTQGASARREQ